MALRKFTYPRTDVTVTEGATVANGGAIPAVVKVVAGYDGSAVRVIKTDSSGRPDVTVNSSALPTGAATSAKQDTGNTSLASIDTKTPALGQALAASSVPVVLTAAQIATLTPLSTVASTQSGTWNITNISGTISLPTGAATSALQTTGNTSLASIDGKFGSLGQKAMAGSAPVVLASDQAAIPVTQSGTWNVTNISGTVSLPTGAATSALQTTGNASLSSIDGKLAANFGLLTGSIRTAAQVGNATGAADFSTGTAGAQTLRVVTATNSPPSLGGSSGNSPGSGTVSTVATITAPASAIGFILMNLDTSTANIRYRIGGTATAASGQQLQPGRDTGFIPCKADISICAESATQNYDVQWVIQ